MQEYATALQHSSPVADDGSVDLIVGAADASAAILRSSWVCAGTVLPITPAMPPLSTHPRSIKLCSSDLSIIVTVLRCCLAIMHQLASSSSPNDWWHRLDGTQECPWIERVVTSMATCAGRVRGLGTTAPVRLHNHSHTCGVSYRHCKCWWTAMALAVHSRRYNPTCALASRRLHRCCAALCCHA